MHALDVPRAGDEQAVLLRRAELVQLLAHVKRHRPVLRPVEEQHRLVRAPEILTHIGVVHVVAGYHAVQKPEQWVRRAYPAAQYIRAAGEAAVGDDELHLLRAAVADLQHRRPAHGKAVEDYLYIRPEAFQQHVEPELHITALEDIIAVAPPAALTGSREVTGEQVKAAALIVVIVHTRRLKMLRAVAMDDEGDAPAGRVRAGVVIALKRVAAVVRQLKADAPAPAQPLGVPVAVEVIVILVPARLMQPPDYPGIAAEDITVNLARRECGSGGACERRDPSRAPHVTGSTAPTVASSEQQAMSIWNGSAPKRPSSAEEPVRLRERL